jgi:hypothetical protein
VRTTAIAAGALAFLITSNAGVAAAAQAPAAQAPAAQPGAPAQGQTQKNWKDRDEYDLYLKITQTADPKQQIQLLQTWHDKYPQSDYLADGLRIWLLALSKLAPTDPQAAQQIIQRGNELLKLDPKNFLAAYFISIYGPKVGGTNPPPDLQASVDTAAHTVLDNLPVKPASTSEADWETAKNKIIAIAHNALAWEAITKKDLATAESEYQASLKADPTQAGISAAYARVLYEDKKIPQALFEYARAGSYDGPGALPDAGKQQALSFFKTEYQNYHGSPDGADQLLAQAKTSALPPDNFTLVSASDVANKQADALNARIASDPAFKIWYAIKQSLQDKGDAFFQSDLKDAEIPGGAEGVKTFNGTVISMDPADHPTSVVIGVEDPTKPDATLQFSQPLPTAALDKIKVGQKLDFSGVADSYTKDPYMLIFKDPTIPGVQTAAPAKTGHARRHH